MSGKDDYQMQALLRYARLGKSIDEARADYLKRMYREANPEIVALFHDEMVVEHKK